MATVCIECNGFTSHNCNLCSGTGGAPTYVFCLTHSSEWVAPYQWTSPSQWTSPPTLPQKLLGYVECCRSKANVDACIAERDAALVLLREFASTRLHPVDTRDCAAVNELYVRTRTLLGLDAAVPKP